MATITKPSSTGSSSSSSSKFPKCIITCHCGASRQTVELEPELEPGFNGKSYGISASSYDTRNLGTKLQGEPPSGPNLGLEINICHCYACRHVTGQMFASWVGIRPPTLLSDGSVEAHANKTALLVGRLQRYRVVLPLGRNTNTNTCTGNHGKGTEDLKLEGEEGDDEKGLLELVTDYYFCSTCGCHLLKRISSGEVEYGGGEEGTGAGSEQDGKEDRWEVATGVIVEDSLISGIGGDDSDFKDKIKWKHQNVDETQDGGLSIWLSGQPPKAQTVSSQNNLKMKSDRALDEPNSTEENSGQQDDDEKEEEEEDNLLKATCHCQNISLSITRPSSNTCTKSSTAPRSNFPDLMYPYISTPKSVISNPDDIKWWLRPGVHDMETNAILNKGESPSASQTSIRFQKSTPTKYLAGTCACRSCRLTSGFEIQSWAFIPRGNISISMHLHPKQSAPDSSQTGTEGGRTMPLEFQSSTTTHPQGVQGNEEHNIRKSRDVWPLKAYESSPGVIREFCPVCGATIFWHDKWRPDLIDVSVGLLRFPGDDDLDLTLHSNKGHGEGRLGGKDGARHESWLEWWKDRVSFAEDAELDRKGGCSLWARELIQNLERGLKGV